MPDAVGRMAGTDVVPLKSKEWRERAEEYRQYAEEAISADGREAFSEIAKNCDFVAERLERLEERERARAAQFVGGPTAPS